jgi:hypothetical protein
LLGTLLGALLLVSLVSEPTARQSLDAIVDPLDTGRALLTLLAALAVVAARPLASMSDRPMPAAPFAMALVLAVVVGFGVAPNENVDVNFATRRPDGTRALVDLVRTSDNGSMSLAWPAFAGLPDIIPGTLIVPGSLSWMPYFEEIAEIPTVVDSYDPTLDRDDLSFQQEWIYDVGLSEEFRMVVVGRGSDYRVFYDDKVLALIAEPAE